MKNLFLVLILLLTIFTSSCNRHKQIIKTENYVKTHSIVKLDVIKTQTGSQTAISETFFVVETITADFTTETIIIITDYTTPDSTGKQFIIKETKIKRNNNITSENKTNLITSDSINSTRQKTYIDNSTTDFKQETKSKTVTKAKTKKNTTRIISTSIIICVILVLLFYRFYPR